MVRVLPLLWLCGGLVFSTTPGFEGAWLAPQLAASTTSCQALSQKAEQQSCGSTRQKACKEGGGAARHPSRLTRTSQYESPKPEVGLPTLQCQDDLHADALHQVPWMVGTMQSSQVEIPVAGETKGYQQRPEQCQEGRGQAVRYPGIYVAFLYEVGWTGSTMAEVDTRWTASQSPAGGQSRTSSTSAVAATSQTSRRATGGGARGSCPHRKPTEKYGVGIHAQVGAGHHCRCSGPSQGPQAGDHAHGPQQGQAAARNQYDAAKAHLKEVDGKWVQFNPSLQMAYNLEREDYRTKRESALEEVKAKRQKLVDIQERIRTSALQQGAREDVIDAPDVPEFKLTEPVDLESEEELMRDAELEHQPNAKPTFGRAHKSPTRQGDTQLGGIPKKVKTEDGTGR